jgi:hypothetical protein
MLTTIFRLGPLVILECGLAIAALAVWIFCDLPSCVCYTLGYFALVTFLIEMVASLRMLKSHSWVRRRFLCARVAESDSRYYARLVWDNLNFLLVIMILYYSLVVDGISLSQLNQKLQSLSQDYSDSTCEFTLFALCLFQRVEKELSNPDSGDVTVMWLLYAASTFITSIVCIAFSREYYQYCASLASNRKLTR